MTTITTRAGKGSPLTHTEVDANFENLNNDKAEVGHGHAFLSHEANLGSSAKRSGKFTISGSGLTIGKPVMIQQAVGPYTGKGTRADEAEMDQVSATASVTAADTITAYWSSPRRVKGNIKFNYQVGA